MRIIPNQEDNRKVLVDAYLAELELIRLALIDYKKGKDLVTYNSCQSTIITINSAVSGRDLVNRKGKHSSVKNTPCPHCTRMVRGERALAYHVKTVHPNAL